MYTNYQFAFPRCIAITRLPSCLASANIFGYVSRTCLLPPGVSFLFTASLRSAEERATICRGKISYVLPEIAIRACCRIRNSSGLITPTRLFGKPAKCGERSTPPPRSSFFMKIADPRSDKNPQRDIVDSHRLARADRERGLAERV